MSLLLYLGVIIAYVKLALHEKELTIVLIC
jgi:hypothetical protein